MRQLLSRINAYRDPITVFTALWGLLSLVLTQLGTATWETVLKNLPAAAAVFVILAWLRPRVFPAWRLLETCLHHGQRFPVTRSTIDALYCAWWVFWRRRGYGLRTFDVARLRVEAEILTGDQASRGTAPYRRAWRKHLSAMLEARRLMQRMGPTRSRFLTKVPDCLPLTSNLVCPGVDRYFKALANLGQADDHFLSHVCVGSAYVAPLYLLTGQLSHFDDTWRSVIHAYSSVTSTDSPIAHEPLRHLRAFQFACWIAWGPSIPICTCPSWSDGMRDAIAFQLGYGDENTSVVLYDERRALRFRLRWARRRVARILAQRGSHESSAGVPLAVELEATAVVRRPRSGDRARMCKAQAELLDAKTDRLLLEFRQLDLTPTTGRSYYSAYLWVMFVLESSPGHLLTSDREPWRALLPFFVHGNIADSSTYAFLKERLANEALDAIEAVVRCPDTPRDVSFVYMSAIDHSGCGHDLLMPDTGVLIKDTLRQLLTDRFRAIATRVRIEETPANLRGADGMYYAEHFSSCHLPEMIRAYFTWLDDQRKATRDGAHV